MRNNWVLLKGRLCHAPNHTATKTGLHKVAFRLAIHRPKRSLEESAPPFPVEGGDTLSEPLPPLSADSDFVTVIIIGKPAWEFKLLGLQAGAPVRVQGRLRSWDIAVEKQAAFGGAPANHASSNGEAMAHRSGRIEVIAEKVEPLAESAG